MGRSEEEPLRGARVLITRAGERSESFAKALRACGAEPILAPTIAIRPLDDPRALDAAIDALGEGGWLIFTSRNGVEAFFERLGARGRDAAALHASRVAAIGPSTAAQLRDAGALVELVADRFVGEALARAIVARAAPGERATIVRARDGGEDLPRLLRAAGLRVQVVAAYETVTASPARFGEKVARAGVLTFTSASTVRGFAELLGSDAAAHARGRCVACIGPVTAAAARAAGLHVDVIAATHTIGGLLDALRAHYGARAC